MLRIPYFASMFTEKIIGNILYEEERLINGKKYTVSAKSLYPDEPEYSKQCLQTHKSLLVAADCQ